MPGDPFAPCPEPTTELGRHRVLASTAGVRVSPLCLGGMSFGGEHGSGAWGECSKDTTFKILDYFHDHGGNFVDTANHYQDDESEEWIDEWMASRGVRDEMVISRKYTSQYKSYKLSPTGIKSNFTGNNRKSVLLSLDASLNKLGTSYVDNLYVHFPDLHTSTAELLQSLHRVVLAGKVLYLGISDTPVWIVSRCNEYARARRFDALLGLPRKVVGL